MKSGKLYLISGELFQNIFFFALHLNIVTMSTPMNSTLIGNNTERWVEQLRSEYRAWGQLGGQGIGWGVEGQPQRPAAG